MSNFYADSYLSSSIQKCSALPVSCGAKSKVYCYHHFVCDIIPASSPPISESTAWSKYRLFCFSSTKLDTTCIFQGYVVCAKQFSLWLRFTWTLVYQLITARCLISNTSCVFLCRIYLVDLIVFSDEILRFASNLIWRALILYNRWRLYYLCTRCAPTHVVFPQIAS